MKSSTPISPLKRLDVVGGVTLRTLRLFERIVSGPMARGYVHYHCAQCLWKGVALEPQAATAVRADLFFVPGEKIVFSAGAEWRSVDAAPEGGRELACLIQSGTVKEFWPKRCPCCRGWLDWKALGPEGGVAHEGII